MRWGGRGALPGLRLAQFHAKRMCHGGKMEASGTQTPPAPLLPPPMSDYSDNGLLLFVFFLSLSFCRYERCTWIEQTELVRRDY